MFVRAKDMCDFPWAMVSHDGQHRVMLGSLNSHPKRQRNSRIKNLQVKPDHGIRNKSQVTANDIEESARVKGSESLRLRELRVLECFFFHYFELLSREPEDDPIS